MILTEPVGPVAVDGWLYRAQFVVECLDRWLSVSSDGNGSLRASSLPRMRCCLDGRLSTALLRILRSYVASTKFSFQIWISFLDGVYFWNLFFEIFRILCQMSRSNYGPRILMGGV